MNHMQEMARKQPPNSPRARHSRWVAMVVLALAPAFASAQLYRSVGPDGRVTYSDTPPAQGSDQRTQQIGKPAVPTTIPASEVGTFMRNATLGAAIKLTVLAGTVDRLAQICGGLEPAVSEPVRTARTLWYANHRPLLSVKDKILSDLLPPNRRDLMSGPEAQAELKRTTAQLASASQEEKTASCRRAPQLMAASGMNLYNSPEVAKLFTSYGR